MSRGLAAPASPFPRLRGKVPGGRMGARLAIAPICLRHLPPLHGGRERCCRGVLIRLAAAFAFAITFALAPYAYAIDPLPFKDRAEEVRFQNLTKQLRCLVCQNQDLADSDADLAKDLRKQVFDMMQSGKSDAEIKQYLVARYNDFVLYDPPLKPGTWLLWFLPFALVLIGAFVVARILRRRASPTDAGDDW
jgi:cytochrome c-type biogenesis protein CcmH